MTKFFNADSAREICANKDYAVHILSIVIEGIQNACAKGATYYTFQNTGVDAILPQTAGKVIQALRNRGFVVEPFSTGFNVSWAVKV